MLAPSLGSHPRIYCKRIAYTGDGSVFVCLSVFIYIFDFGFLEDFCGHEQQR